MLLNNNTSQGWFGIKILPQVTDYRRIFTTNRLTNERSRIRKQLFYECLKYLSDPGAFKNENVFEIDIEMVFNVFQLIGYQSSFKGDCRISVNNRMFSQFSEVFLIGKFIIL